MTDLRPNRRQVLKRAGAVAATAALLSPSAALAKTTSATASIVGSWIFTVTSTSGSPFPPFKALATFDQGGTLVETEQGDEAPEQENILASPGHGAWTRTGSDDFAYNFLKLLYDTSGNFAGLVKNHGTSQVEGDTLTGSGTFVATDPTGKVIETGTYASHATRIQVEGA